MPWLGWSSRSCTPSCHDSENSWLAACPNDKSCLRISKETNEVLSNMLIYLIVQMWCEEVTIRSDSS